MALGVKIQKWKVHVWRKIGLTGEAQVKDSSKNRGQQVSSGGGGGSTGL